MTFNDANPYLYEIGERVFVYTIADDFEATKVYDRKQEFGTNWYMVDWGWEKEPFLRKD